MRKTLCSTLVWALLMGLWSCTAALAGSASDPKPLAVVSVASYDEFMGSIELAGTLSGRPKLAKALKGSVAVLTHGKGLAGLDKTKPWGVVIQAVEPKPSGYAFLPVTNLQKFLEVVRPLVDRTEDLGGGTYKLEGGKARLPAYARSNDQGWLFLSDKPELLADAPRDPLPLLEGLHQQYDLAVRLNLGNVAAEHRSRLLAKMRRDLENELKQRPGEDDQEYAIRKIVTAKVCGVVLTMVEDLDAVTLGWSFDQDAPKALVGIDLIAKPGSKTARALAELGQAKTHFAGFRLPSAALTCSFTATCPYAGSADLDGLFDALRDSVFEQIDGKEPSAERAEAAQEIVGGLLDVVQKTVASGRVDGAASVVLTPEAATLVAGRYVADGPKLEETLKKLVEAVRKEHPHYVDKVLKTDVDELDGVRFHMLSLELPHDIGHREKVVRLVGETLQVVVGIGDEAVYLAVGKDALETLKRAIEQSASRGPQEAAPAECSVALGQLARFVAQVGPLTESRQAAKVLAALEDAPGKDRIRLVALPVERGVRLRVEFEEGLLKVIEAISKK